MRVRTAIGWSLVVALVVLGASGAAAGQGDASPCDDVLSNRTDDGPGGELAGAIGEQEAAIDSELADRRFDARLRNATTDAERADVVATELDRLRSHVDALEACAAFLRNASATDGERARALAARANATATRVNETAAAAERLPADLRRQYGVDAAAFDLVLERVVALREAFDADAAGGRGDTAGQDDGTGDGSNGPFR